MSEKRPKEHLSIYRPTLLKERIAELEAAVLREKRRVDSLHHYINERDAEIARLRGVVQYVLDDATPEKDRGLFSIDSDVYWTCFEALQENSDE
jgi:uncharacterized coiled-coil protein SlyX